MRIVVIGNSGSGKTTLSRRLGEAHGLAHLDLDPLAWLQVVPPKRRPVAESAAEILRFVDAHERWVIEGCYADLARFVLPHCSLLVFANPGVEACVANARARPWEPHKYASPEAQDANLDMLLGWIRSYETRMDGMSLRAHRALFEGFAGNQIELVTREQIAAFAP